MWGDSGFRRSSGEDVLHYLQFVLVLLFARLIRLIPLDIGTRLGGAIARIIAPRVALRRHELALQNLRVAFPDKSDAERERICLDHWENFGRVVVETLQIDRLIKDPSRIEIVSDYLVERYHNKLGPAIGVSLHMGNWEIAIWPLVVAGGKPAAVYRALENPRIDRYLRDRRKSIYPGGMFGRSSKDDLEREDLRTARNVTDFVRRGGRLGIVCDQHYNRGVPVRFFGRTIRSQPLAAIIARRVGARVWIARCLRIGKDSRFKIEFKELKVPRTANQAADVHALLVSMHRQFEDWITDAPDQWVWSNKHWV